MNKEYSNKGLQVASNYLVMGCVHVPFQNKKLMNGVFQLMEDFSFDGLVLAGDYLDMGTLGQYERGKMSNTGITLEDEYDEGNVVLNDLSERLKPNSEKVFLFGNHEARYWRWKSEVDNHKYGDPLNPITALKLKDRGFEVVDDYVNGYYNLGSLMVMHGEYFNVHCAKKHLDVLRRNVLFFHTHRVQMFREGDFAAYNAGSLANFKSPAFNYAKHGMKSAWGNAFAIVTVAPDGSHFVNIINCINDRFTFNGKIYGG